MSVLRTCILCLAFSAVVDAPAVLFGAESFLLRVATFNTALSRDASGEMRRELASGKSTQAALVAEVLRRVRPDVVLLNEFDFDSTGAAADSFQKQYLERGLPQLAPLQFEHRFLAPVNTGVPSGMDLNADGVKDGPEDAFGFGRHAGQYGMLVLSRFPIDATAARTFQTFRWADMPSAEKPMLDGKPYYPEATFGRLRLASKSVWDLPRLASLALSPFWPLACAKHRGSVAKKENP